MPSLKSRDLNAPADAAPASPNSAAENPANRQTVALEVPVTVNGARPLEGSEKREPFSESTKTVLVFSNGAVIRLASAVAAGQLLFLTNEKTKKEVVCQVVKSKSYSNVSGYVELQFSEPVAGFWGVRFPSDRAGSLSSAQASEGLGPGANLTGGVAKIVAEQFKTELKADDRSSNRAALLTPAEPSTEALKLEANRLQEQLSTLMFAEQGASKAGPPSAQASDRALSDTTAKLFEIAESKESEKAAPTLAATVKANLPAEEVKIPSWLEPLARNSGTPAPPAEAAPAEATAPKEGKKLQTPKSPAKAASGKAKAAAAPLFGKTLLEPSAASSASHGSHKTLIFAIAAGLVVAAAGATWYLRQPSSLWPGTGGAAAMNSGPAMRPAASAPASTVAPASSTAAAEPSRSAAQTQLQSNLGLRAAGQTPQATPASSVAPSTASAGLGPAQIKAQPAVISERVPSAAASPLTASATADTGAEAVEPEAKRAGLGKVRLAKPKVNRTRQAGIAEPTLGETDGQAVPESGSLGGALAGENSPQPTAPETPIGGDVKPARLVSSVPPVYPALAKAQHVAGDVRIDALVDATGRVSSMKVVSGPTLLHTAAMEALRKWRYQPATLDGNAVSMHLTVTIQFRLQ